MEASLDQKQRLQTVFFPEGLRFDGEGFGTAATCLAFKQLGPGETVKDGMASLTTPSWNRYQEILTNLRYIHDVALPALEPANTAGETISFGPGSRTAKGHSNRPPG